MTTEAKVICHSVSEAGKEIVTLQLRYPRFIHAEFMTHRAFSRNASSSRAVPVAKLIEDIERGPAMPSYWGKNQPGMQAAEDLDSISKALAQTYWQRAMLSAIKDAKALHEIGAHKQIVNRILEPFSHINVVCTSTEWQNFFNLRCHKDAQPEIQELANAMFKAMSFSTPKLLKIGEWHTPYVEDEEFPDPDDLGKAIACSVARCARVSYLTHEGKAPKVEEDLKLYERLVGSVPIHASPAEHQATPLLRKDARSNNFLGWLQYREILEETAIGI